jgi:NADH:ubiquinone reductase (H+-translocating)
VTDKPTEPLAESGIEPNQRLVIIGGGFAGFWAAAAGRRVGGDALDITLISSGPVLQMRPRFYEANPASLSVELAPLLSTIGVSLVVDTAIGLDVVARSVALESGSVICYDRLVVAAGSTMNRQSIAGMETAYSIDTQVEAIAFDKRLAELSSQEATEPICVVVIGAGFTGIELALELRDRMRTYEIAKSDEMRIVLVDRNQTVGKDLGPNPRPLIEVALADARVETRLGVSIVAVTPTSVTFADSTVVRADAMVLATGLRAATFVELVPGERDSLGRVVVDRSLRCAAAPEIFVTGDAAAADTGDGNRALQSCQHALQLGRFAGENAARDLLGLPTIEYTQSRYVTCLDLGRSGAVLTSGWNREVVMSGENAKALKRKINGELIYPPANADRETLLGLSLTTPE